MKKKHDNAFISSLCRNFQEFHPEFLSGVTLPHFTPLTQRTHEYWSWSMDDSISLQLFCEFN